jgi:hypothetical protein
MLAACLVAPEALSERRNSRANRKHPVKLTSIVLWNWSRLMSVTDTTTHSAHDIISRGSCGEERERE